MSQPFLTVYGHVAIDQILTVAKFPENNTSVDVTEKSTHLGGTGANIAVTAARLGVPTALCALVGADFPKTFEESISEAGVLTDELVKVDGYDTSQAIVVSDDAMDQKVLFYQGPQGYASKIGIDLLKNAKMSQHVHFCTGDPEYYISLMKEIECPMAIDPAQEVHRIWNPDSLKRALAHCDSLFCNRFEAESVVKYLGVDSVADIDKPLVVCTCGAKGSDVYIEGEHFHIPAIPAENAVDPTGAGDAYRAGYYAGLYHGFEVHESLVIAATVSSFVVEDYGALTAAPTWGDVLERAGKYLRDI